MMSAKVLINRKSAYFLLYNFFPDVILNIIASYFPRNLVLRLERLFKKRHFNVSIWRSYLTPDKLFIVTFFDITYRRKRAGMKEEEYAFQITYDFTEANSFSIVVKSMVEDGIQCIGRVTFSNKQILVRVLQRAHSEVTYRGIQLLYSTLT